MSIILNEYDWAERMIANNELGQKPTETFSRIARYYLANQYSKKEVRQLLDTFAARSAPDIPITQWSGVLDYVTKSADKYAMIRIDCIEITEPELEKISELKGIVVRRLAFALLCVAKYWDAVSEKNNHWVNTSDSEVMQMANIKLSVRKQCDLFGQLIDAGYLVNSRRVDNLNVRVTYVTDGKVAMRITDFRNLGYQYMYYYGGSFYECENCGLTVKYTPSRLGGRPPKYCPACATEIHTQHKINAVKKQRYTGSVLPQ